MSDVRFTPQQQQAVETVGTNVTVSAAAGSGKTAVLAERCAYLVCDAPAPFRCNVDQLLVLTFTEAAAAEMRGRIVEAIRRRSRARPDDQRLREQADLLDVAQISTIHSFCLWMIRRWSTEIGIDPTSTLLDEHEEVLLKADVLEGVFASLYAAGENDEHPFIAKREQAEESLVGRDARYHAVRSQSIIDPSVANDFVRFVDIYGLGDDRSIARFATLLHDFTRSLPDPDSWLRSSYEVLSNTPEQFIIDMIVRLSAELTWQTEYCGELLRDACEIPEARFYLDQVADYREQLAVWSKECDEFVSTQARSVRPQSVGCVSPAPNRTFRASEGVEIPSVSNLSFACAKGSDTSESDSFQRFDSLLSSISNHEFDSKGSPRLSKNASTDLVEARDAARSVRDSVKKKLHEGRLKERFAAWTTEQWIEGVRSTAPFVKTLVELVNLFGREYAEQKRRLGVMDFADLERFAYELLHDPQDPAKPSKIAEELQRRFVQVLVDEFQDINPLQQAIIGLVSREANPELDDNLFVVGDVKQSIYRFRLAEPELFLARMNHAHETTTDQSPVQSRDRQGAVFCASSERSGALISLQSNFRSRPTILDAVNLIFRQIMRGIGSAIQYDERSELRAARSEIDARPTHSVEFHLLERRLTAQQNNEDDDGDTDVAEPAGLRSDQALHWNVIERESFLIGQRIKELIGATDVLPDASPLRYRDMVILLRSKKVHADQMAAMLNRLGIPAHAEASGALFDALEVRDSLAALQLFDNAKQDIPLAAVMRNGILGLTFTEDELVETRCIDRAIAFHAAVRQYAQVGQVEELRARVAKLLQRIEHFRGEVRNRPIADVIWSLYHRFGFLAFVCGLPHGQIRRANLLKLHDLARTFGTFRKQGLHRFLRTIEAMQEQDRDIGVAPVLGAADDVVRIMSIHASKGLEFPVVFVAGLGNKMNFRDCSGRMIFERKAKIGLRVVDTFRMVEYASAAHRQAADEIERTTREEEMRLLYVAMTRAREKLILVGSAYDVESKWSTVCGHRNARPVSAFTIATAQTALDWLIPAVQRTAFDVRPHLATEIVDWSLDSRKNEPQKRFLDAAALGETLPTFDFDMADQNGANELLARIDFSYPRVALTTVKAAMGASEFKRRFDAADEFNDRAEPPRVAFDFPAGRQTSSTLDRAIRRGVVTHSVLQHLDFAAAQDLRSIDFELQRFMDQGVLAADELQLVDRAALSWFVSTPLADAIRKSGKEYRREFQYIAKERPEWLDPTVQANDDDMVLVRGIVDGILPRGDGIEIVDFKTDGVNKEQVFERANMYRPQMTMYARAMARIWKRRVTACHLVFLAASEIVTWSDLTVDSKSA